MRHFDFDDYLYMAWHFLLWSAVALLLIFVVISAFSDHRVRSYYVGGHSSPGSGALTTQCVYADTPWEGDDRVFCSQDPLAVLDFAEKSNRLVKK